GAAVRRDDRDQVGKLLRLKREKLVAGLRSLQCPGRALALTDKRRHLRTVAVDVADRARLHAHGVLQAADRVLPTRARIRDKLGVGRRKRDISITLLESLVDLPDLERDVLRLAEKLLRALDVLLERLERGIRQARQI